MAGHEAGRPVAGHPWLREDHSHYPVVTRSLDQPETESHDWSRVVQLRFVQGLQKHTSREWNQDIIGEVVFKVFHVGINNGECIFLKTYITTQVLLLKTFLKTFLKTPLQDIFHDITSPCQDILHDINTLLVSRHISRHVNLTQDMSQDTNTVWISRHISRHMNLVSRHVSRH